MKRCHPLHHHHAHNPQPPQAITHNPTIIKSLSNPQPKSKKRKEKKKTTANRDRGRDRAPFWPRRRPRLSSILSKSSPDLFLDLLQTAETEAEIEMDARTKGIKWTQARSFTKEHEMNEGNQAMWVESFACLFVHQYISNDCIGSDGAIEPELVTRSACNDSSKRKIFFEERVKYGCDCGCCDSWPVVKLLILS